MYEVKGVKWVGSKLVVLVSFPFWTNQFFVAFK